jgi:CO/xanthine dehydrogenase Mo-binding subunit
MMSDALIGPEPLIGGRVARLDAPGKVTGAARYPDDLAVEGMAYGRILRSSQPHARVAAIDLSAARALPGVVAAVCGDDIAGPGAYGLVTPDQPVLARRGGKVRYVGDAVAAVVAETPDCAEAALAAIRVDYEPLPVVEDPRLAARPDAPLVHDALGTNVLHSVRLRHGDITAGFAAADVIVEGRYTTPFIEHAYLQPEAGLAAVGADGRLTVWTATQWPDEDRRQIAYALGLPIERVREIVTAVGGAFGGREDISVQIVLAFLALHTGRPVKLTHGRTESFIASTKRHPFDMLYRTGATKAGRLTAVCAELVANAGAYASTSLSVLNTAVTLATASYDVPHVAVDAQAVFTNAPPAAAMRGFGANQPNFAMEMQIGRLAAAVGLDPAEMRRRNLLRNGSAMPTGQILEHGVGLEQCLVAALARAAERGLRPGARRVEGQRRYGVGLALGCKNVGYNLGWDDHSTAVVEAYPERAVVKVGAIEVGQGSTTAMAQLAASQLELPLSAIEMITDDTDQAPDAGSSSASRHTFVTGNAVLAAAAEAARRLADLGPHPTAAELPVVAQATYHAPKTYPMDPETGQTLRANPTYGYGCQIVEVSVDVGTGEVRLLQAITANDVGQAINRIGVEGQAEGGLVMGQGYSLLEEYVLEGGQPKTTTLATFLIPTALDVPERIDALTVEVLDADGPYGAKGVGEMTMLATPGAIAAAIYDATDKWIDDLPITPERVLRALGKV